MSTRTAFITGITGQDGSYLSEYLLEQGYSVHGLVRRLDLLESSNIAHLASDEKVLNHRLFLHSGDFENTSLLRELIYLAKPDEFYHLAGQSNPALSLEEPEATVESNGMATIRLLEIFRETEHPTKFLYASSSEIFGTPESTSLNENSPINPKTPYGAAKAFSQQITKIYRESYGLPCCSTISFNHESPRRSTHYLPMKVARAAVEIKLGRKSNLQLGNLDAQRDWGWAPDYARGMAMILQSEAPEDFILATGKLHSVKQLAEKAFRYLGLDWKDYVTTDPALLRKADPIAPCGNPSKAKELLGWQPTVHFDDIIEQLVDSELRQFGS